MLDRKSTAFLRWQLAKMNGNYIDLPHHLKVPKDTLSRWWRTDNNKISIETIEKILNENNAPKIVINVSS